MAHWVVGTVYKETGRQPELRAAGPSGGRAGYGGTEGMPPPGTSPVGAGQSVGVGEGGTGPLRGKGSGVSEGEDGSYAQPDASEKNSKNRRGGEKGGGS